MKLELISKYFVLFLLIICADVLSQNTVRYDLYVRDTVMNYTGQDVDAISINGQMPAPTLNFTEGDTAEIYVHNTMDVETSIHWHGIILPNQQDGVPYLTTAPIEPNTTHLYKFPVVQNGTYWYHSHTELQEQSGMFGALILHRKEQQDSVYEFPVVISDWTNENPSEVLRSLKMANDWYAIEKGSTQSYGEALTQGYLGTKLENEWKRQFVMDVSDVYYDTFLMNGKKQQKLPALKAGDKIKLRVVNGSSSTYFWLQFAGGKLTVVASDGEDVTPVEVDRMIIGVAETYDIIVTIPENMSYEFRATAEDRTKYTSLWLGDGMKMPAPKLKKLMYFEGMMMMNDMMNFDGSMDNMGMKMTMQKMDMNEVMYPEIMGDEEPKEKPKEEHQHEMKDMKGSEDGDIVTLNYAMLRSTRKTNLPEAPTKILKFKLTGNMNRYQWTMDDKPLSETDKILIKKGENVRLILDNQSMMRHPMHLHGQFFRVLNGNGDYSPLKNVLDIMPMEVDTIEFNAPYDGDWFFHCHILYHMMSGMGRVFSVGKTKPNAQLDTIPDVWNTFLSEDNMFHFSGSLTAQSQGLWGKTMLMNRNYVFDAMGILDYKGNFESEARLGRYFGKMQWLKFYVGADVRIASKNTRLHSSGPDSTLENRKLATLGVQYILPMFLLTDLRVDHKGKFRFQISRSDLALTSRLRFDGLWNTDKEYEMGLRYIITKRFSLSANYDSHFGLGGGIVFTY
jgi:FtsP/CotA-like multicopper oxidase with cupredoxin domain